LGANQKLSHFSLNEDIFEDAAGEQIQLQALRREPFYLRYVLGVVF
jgi:hypothetical protein